MGLSISINDQAAFNVVIGIPGPAGPAGPQGPAGPSGASVWGSITGTLSSQTDLQSALNAKLSTSAASSTYLPLAGGYITGDLESNNGSGYRTWNGSLNTAVLKPDYLQLTYSGSGGNALTVEWNGITFADGKQTVRYPGTSILSGYATESWVTTQLGSYLTIASAASNYYPLTSNPAGYLTSSALTGYATQSWVTSQGYLVNGDNGTVPAGGTTGQVLAKASGSNYSLVWESIILGDRYLTTSTTSLAVSNGTKNLTVGTGLSYSPQQDIIIAYDSAHHMHAVVISYNSGTGAMVADVQQHTGSGTYASWTVNVGGTVPVQSVAWGDITGTIGSQSDLATELNAKLNTVDAASTYYPLTNPAGYIDASALSGYATESWVSYWFYPLSGNPSGFVDASYVASQGFLTDAPSDDQTYGRKNGSWVVAGGGGSFDGGTITNPLTVLTGTSSSVTVDTAGVYAYDLTSSGSIGTTLDYAGFSNFSGTNAFNINPSYGLIQDSASGAYAVMYQNGVEAGDGMVSTKMSSTGIQFPDSTTQATAAVTVTNNNQLATTVNAFSATHYLDMADKNGIVLCQSGCSTIYLTDASAGWSVGQQVLIVNNTGSIVSIANSGSTSYFSYNGGYLLGVNGCCAAVYIDTNLWVISGNLTT